MSIGAGVATDGVAGHGEPPVPHGHELVRFAESANAGAGDLGARRAELVAAVGQVGALEAALTVSAFNGLVRVADGTGIAVDDGVARATADVRDQLEVAGFAGAHSSAPASSGEGVPSTVEELFR